MDEPQRLLNRPWRVFVPLVVLVLTPLPIPADEPIVADVLLKGGMIHDGRGNPAFVGDVAIRDNKIIGVGEMKLDRANRVIDCTGLFITPGFIDLHTHSDEQVVSTNLRGCVNYLLQGCTTSVTGNCGSGPIDVDAYYKKIDESGAGTNVAHLIPQGSLRERVVGLIDRRATDEELRAMRNMVDQGMREGAWGISSGLIYVPSNYANTAELSDLAKAVGEHHGIYASHIRGEGRELLTAVDEAIQIGKAGNCAVHVSHFKASGMTNWGTIRQAAEQIEQARGSGQVVTADQYPYTASSTSLQATLFPTWARSGGTKGLIERLNDPVITVKVRADVQKSLDSTRGGETVVIARFAANQSWVGKNVLQLAQETGKSAFEVACDIVKQGDAGVINFSMSEDDVRWAMQRPWVATASDGRSYLPGPDKPHPRSYGTFARKIGHYALAENVIPVEAAIRSCSGLPADIIGFRDRGYLTVGYLADVVVLDPKTYVDVATYENPHRYAAGVRYVFVNGVPAVHEGQYNGAMAGKALRKVAGAVK